MDSYTNPYGSQPSIPNGGQFQPTNYPPQGDIILTPSQPRKFDLKRILILVGIGLAVLTLFIVVIVVISGNNRTASEAKAADRAEKVAALNRFYSNYSEFLEYYSEIGYTPSYDMAQELEDTSRMFVVKKSTLNMMVFILDSIEKELEEIDNTDFGILGGEIQAEVGQIVGPIKADLSNIEINVSILESFYNVFIVPVENDLYASTAVANCDFSAPENYIEELPIDGFAMEDAIDKYVEAYCAINDELYHGTFDGYFGSEYVRDAKEALIKTLVSVRDQSSSAEELKQLLEKIGE